MDKPTTSRRIVLPRGVELRTNKSGERLRVTFTHHGQRRREMLPIDVTPANIKYAGKLIASIELAIEKGTFDYAATFPQSKFARLLAKEAENRRQKVGDLILNFIDTARELETLSPTSLASYTRWNNARIDPKWGNTWIDDMTTFELRTWIVMLAGELAPKSVRNCIGVLSTILSQAYSDGLITSNPLAPIKLRTLLPKKKKAGKEEKIDPFNDDEIRAILDSCKTIEERCLYQFAFSTGLRTGELIALKWRHIDWKKNSVHVQDNIVSGETGTVEKTTKTETERDIPLLPAALHALQTMQSISKSLQIGDYIFTNPYKRQRWTDSHQIRKCWVITLRTAKVRYRNPYQTRHTFASRLLANGEQELLVAKLLGHTTVEMVRRHYGRYIRQPEGIQLRGDYSTFGNAPPMPQIKDSTG